MKPIYLASLILLAVTLGFALLGLVLVGFKRINSRNATRYTQLCTALLLGIGVAMAQTEWHGLQLRPIDFWSLMVIGAIVSYSVIWAALAYRLNKVASRAEFDESYMLSMLHSDSQQPMVDGFEQTRAMPPQTHKPRG